MKIRVQVAFLYLLWCYLESSEALQQSIRKKSQVNHWTENEQYASINQHKKESSISSSLKPVAYPNATDAWPLDMPSSVAEDLKAQVKKSKKTKKKYERDLSEEEKKIISRALQELLTQSQFQSNRSKRSDAWPMDIPLVIKPKTEDLKKVAKVSKKVAADASANVTGAAEVLQNETKKQIRVKRQVNTFSFPNPNPVQSPVAQPAPYPAQQPLPNSNWPSMVPAQQPTQPPQALPANVTQNYFSQVYSTPSQTIQPSAPAMQIAGMAMPGAPVNQPNPAPMPSNNWLPQAPTTPPPPPPTQASIDFQPAFQVMSQMATQTTPAPAPSNIWMPVPATTWAPTTSTVNAFAAASSFAQIAAQASSSAATTQAPASAAAPSPSGNAWWPASPPQQVYASTQAPSTNGSPAQNPSAAQPAPTGTLEQSPPVSQQGGNTTPASPAGSNPVQSSGNAGTPRGQTGQTIGGPYGQPNGDNGPNSGGSGQPSGANNPHGSGAPNGGANEAPNGGSNSGNGPSSYNGQNDQNVSPYMSSSNNTSNTNSTPPESTTNNKSGIVRRRKIIRKKITSVNAEVCDEEVPSKNSTTTKKRVRKRVKKVGKGNTKRAGAISRRTSVNALTKTSQQKPPCIQRQNMENGAIVEGTTQDPRTVRNEMAKKGKPGVIRNKSSPRVAPAKGRARGGKNNSPAGTRKRTTSEDEK